MLMCHRLRQAVRGQGWPSLVALRRGLLGLHRFTVASRGTAAGWIGITTEQPVSDSGGWGNLRKQPLLIQGLVCVFALPVAIWLWASGRSSARVPSFCLAALVTLGCLAFPFMGGSPTDSVRTTAADGSSSNGQSGSTKATITTTSTTPRTTPPSTAPATIPATVATPAPITAPPQTQPPATQPPAAQAPTSQSGNAAQLLSQVSVRDESSDSGYDRDLFNHWIDADGNGCDTRCEVLKIERLPSLSGLPGGGWLSLYDGKVTENPSEFDIDHLVALGEAWRSGASEWDGARRQAFANDLDDPRALIAVTASSNRSKSDRDPSSWQPPDKAYWCTYVTEWMAVKLKWGLAVDPIEFTALQSIVEGC